MARIQLVKTNGRLAPLTEDDKRRVSSLADGEIIEADAKLHRNSRFHRKFMAMMRYAYEQYADSAEDNEQPLPFDDFRKEITKAAGFFILHYLPDGSYRRDAKSLAFASMEEDEFRQVYDRCCKVVLDHILTNWTPEDLERATENADEFREQFVG